MKLIIGGAFQGKRHYVLTNYGISQDSVWTGQLPQELGEGTIVIDQLHRWIFDTLEKGLEPEALLRTFLQTHPDCIFISDEVGCGIVPIEQKERQYREKTGRLLTFLAGEAEEVVRVTCGIGQILKGN
ncbi:MAG: bifunctional adenosylcobinamide kinase/adenosylcobinamide-phosphate guanylyltransferase [Oscillospiraceae bacterium]|nr:bifunctional adenosylcobinamide kinase/adenosylcobinamide-phosphate guanylyltransferase [Oscillospiraceae bacterium]